MTPTPPRRLSVLIARRSVCHYTRSEHPISSESTSALPQISFCNLREQPVHRCSENGAATTLHVNCALVRRHAAINPPVMGVPTFDAWGRLLTPQSCLAPCPVGRAAVQWGRRVARCSPAGRPRFVASCSLVQATGLSDGRRGR